MLRKYLTVLCLALSACDLLGPTFSDDAMEIGPLARYTLWWSLVEQCSGHSGRLSAVRFYWAHNSNLVVDGDSYDGYWWQDGNRIVLVNPYNGPLVRHEMLHALLQGGGHPLDEFAGKCAGVVAFDAPETFGVSPTDAASAPTLSPDSALTITVAVDPVVPRMSQFDGWFILTVTARNRTGNPVWVPMPNELLAYANFAETGYGPGQFTQATRFFFAPNQERRVLLDATVDSAGTFHVIAGYAGAASPSTPLVVAP